MRPTLSIVTTLYGSADHLVEFHTRMTAAATRLNPDYELILVEDGSTDRSLEVALSICARDSRVEVIELSRNFGHHRAMMTGLARARGELVFLIDCDLEEQPEWLEGLLARLQETGADVAYGVQSARKGSWFERVSGDIFYRLFNLLSDYPVPSNVSTARLMRRRYVRSLVAHRDRELFMAGLWAVTGYRQVSMPVTKKNLNPTTYTLRRRIRILIDAVTSFSRKPLVLIFYLGIGVVLISTAAGVYLVWLQLSEAGFLPGWASLIVSVWILGGLTLFSIGLIGIYLSRIFIESKRRPLTIVRQVYRQETLAQDGIHGRA